MHVVTYFFGSLSYNTCTTEVCRAYNNNNIKQLSHSCFTEVNLISFLMSFDCPEILYEHGTSKPLPETLDVSLWPVIVNLILPLC